MRVANGEEGVLKAKVDLELSATFTSRWCMTITATDALRSGCPGWLGSSHGAFKFSLSKIPFFFYSTTKLLHFYDWRLLVLFQHFFLSIATKKWWQIVNQYVLHIFKQPIVFKISLKMYHLTTFLCRLVQAFINEVHPKLSLGLLNILHKNWDFLKDFQRLWRDS